MRNAFWIIACKIVQSLFALVINMMTARYLGPSNYGIINYAASLVAFAEPLVLLGQNSILVHELLKNPEDEGRTLGTSIVLSMISAVLCTAAVALFVRIANAGEQETILVCTLYSAVLIFKAMELIQYWYQAKLLSKYPSIVMLCAYLAVSLYRIILLIQRRSIYWFSVINALDIMLIALALLAIYRHFHGQKLCFSAGRARELLSVSRYFIVSTMMITIFAQTDKIMLKLMVGEEETGFYAAAVTCALLSNFVFSALFDSARPSILASKKTDQGSFEEKIICLYSVILYLSLGQGLFFFLLAEPIMGFLYGAQFAGAADILRIVIWYTVFSYAGMVRSIWILAEQLHRYLWVINLCGAGINILLNMLLIPISGAAGAAVASIATQFFTNVLLGFVIRPLRRNNVLMIRGLNPKYLLRMYAKFQN